MSGNMTAVLPVAVGGKPRLLSTQSGLYLFIQIVASIDLVIANNKSILSCGKADVSQLVDVI